jgi:predicted nuclease with TOPRIM domain
MVMDIREAMIKALRKKYEAVIGEHPQFIEELDKLMSKIAEAEDKLTVVNQRFDEDIPF